VDDDPENLGGLKDNDLVLISSKQLGGTLKKVQDGVALLKKAN
jgi:hypothetical protein